MIIKKFSIFLNNLKSIQPKSDKQEKIMDLF